MKEFNKTQELLKLKIKQNKNTYIKRISIILSCVILVIGVLYFTFAKFESNKSYTLIQGKLGDYSSGDLTIGAIIDGVSSSSFPENNGKYNLSKIECTNEEGALNVEYDKSTWEITKLALTSKTKCTAYFDNIEEWIFEYKNEYQQYKVPKKGVYKIELWGAQGNYDGPGHIPEENAGQGGYTSGVINLEKDNKLYIFVGQHVNSSNYDIENNTFNGGGQSKSLKNNYAYYGSAGGGATDIRFFGNNYNPSDADLLWNSILGLRSRIMVAGAGGGGSYQSGYSSNSVGGNGGGLTGGLGNGWYSGSLNYSYGGNQTSGGATISSTHTTAYSGAFGIGGDSLYYTGNPWNYAHGGGGAGYYGGGAGAHYSSGGVGKITGGGGGSSYISGHTGCVAITSASDQSPKSGCTTGTTDNNCSIHYSGLKFTNTKMIDGKGYPWTNVVGTTYEKMPKPEGGYYDEGKGHTGNGYARITYLGE